MNRHNKKLIYADYYFLTGYAKTEKILAIEMETIHPVTGTCKPV